ncbi:hypothetical protein [Moorella sulfitireducens (nom. illeg.)]|uniref:hypothetical protein n=1 Tax=Neomoorella sulfitireducens TaxID=2972948 RepID=UPI0021ACA67B|nr:hypothetical protein [Moorella sulfitireducens]
MEPSVDTLGRWMAHYIAELIRKAEETDDPDMRSKVQEKCCETILKLWEHRAMLPRGARPLANLEGVLLAIEKFRGEQSPWSVFSREEAERVGGPWIWFAKVVEDIGLRMCRIAVLTAIAEASLGKEKRWLQEHKEMLSEEEIKIIQALDSWLSEEMIWQSEQQRVSVGDLEPSERTRRVFEEIQASIEQMKSSFELLLNKVKC